MSREYRGVFLTIFLVFKINLSLLSSSDKVQFVRLGEKLGLHLPIGSISLFGIEEFLCNNMCLFELDFFFTKIWVSFF